MGGKGDGGVAARRAMDHELNEPIYQPIHRAEGQIKQAGVGALLGVTFNARVEKLIILSPNFLCMGFR